MTLRSLQIDGVRIAFAEQGQGPHLVLLHGMFGDHQDWEAVFEPLSRNFHVIAVDLPGFGASGKPAIDYSLEFYLRTLHGLFTALKLDRFHLIGNSFGGQLAVYYALLFPAQVSKLVLVDSGGFRQIPRDEREQTMHAFSENNLLHLHQFMVQYLFSPAFAHASAEKTRYISRQTERLHSADYPAYAHAIAEAIRVSLNTYLFDRLHELHCPTLLLWGDHDTLCPVEQARAALKQLRLGSLQVFRQCGHLPQLDAPHEFLAAVTTFLLLEAAGAASVPEPLVAERI